MSKSGKQDRVKEYRLNGTKRYGVDNDPDSRAYETRDQAEQRQKALEHPIRIPRG